MSTDADDRLAAARTLRREWDRDGLLYEAICDGAYSELWMIDPDRWPDQQHGRMDYEHVSQAVFNAILGVLEHPDRYEAIYGRESFDGEDVA